MKGRPESQGKKDKWAGVLKAYKKEGLECFPGPFIYELISKKIFQRRSTIFLTLV